MTGYVDRDEWYPMFQIMRDKKGYEIPDALFDKFEKVEKEFDEMQKELSNLWEVHRYD
jgi:hypothetical protein